MGNKGYGSIPGTLFECITFLARALPVRSVPTYIELLIGLCSPKPGLLPELGWRSTPCAVGALIILLRVQDVTNPGPVG